jgi:SWI/SNF-related matrix-associated actin-dependent regulator 1 of chromatin subfamily A
MGGKAGSDMSEDFDLLASRAIAPFFYRAPHPAVVMPYNYQLAGVEYALARDHCLIGDAPGLGKTAQAIMVSNGIKAEHTLVVCPASLRLNWEREIWRWSTIPGVTTYPILKAKDGVSLEANYVIISYDLLRNASILDAILSCTWDHLILDEAHYIKEPKGNTRTRPICAPDCLPSVVGRITMASGTILPNQPIECYNAVRLLNWKAIDQMSLADFREYYYDFGEGFITRFDRKTKKFKREWSDHVRNVPRRMEDLQHRLRKHVMVRRLKEEVLHELPPLRWHLAPMAMTSGIKSALDHPGWAVASKLYELDPGSFDTSVSIDGAVSTARRLLGEAKAPEIAGYILDMLESGVEKLVVAAWHRSTLDILREALEPYGLSYMDGSSTPKRRQSAVDAFQTDPKIRIILGQTQTIGEGWTLTKAQDIVLAEPDWTPGRNQQVADRIHRIGQQGESIQAHVPVVPGTLDERIVGRAIEKDRAIFCALDKPLTTDFR